MSVITFSHITKSFGKNIALDDVSFTVEPGTVFALLGENGAGKTTTIKTLLGLCEPDQGSSTVLGFDSRKDDLKIRQAVGYVPEQPVLYDWMSVTEIGKFAASFYPPEYLKRYGELLNGYGITENSVVKNLSKGQRAKVSLALALAHDPELLILDEPTSGLDALVRREFLESMLDRAATGKTVFLSSHQIGEVERVADTVAIIKKSKLLLVESLESLKQRTQIVTVTLKEPDTALPDLFEKVIEQRINGRDVKILGHHLRDDAEQTLQSGACVTRCEIRTPSLEEIFIGYME